MWVLSHFAFFYHAACRPMIEISSLSPADPTRTVSRSMRLFELLLGLLVLVVLGSFVALLVEVDPVWKDVFHGYVPSSGIINNGGIYIAVGLVLTSLRVLLPPCLSADTFFTVRCVEQNHRRNRHAPCLLHRFKNGLHATNPSFSLRRRRRGTKRRRRRLLHLERDRLVFLNGRRTPETSILCPPESSHAPTVPNVTEWIRFHDFTEDPHGRSLEFSRRLDRRWKEAKEEEEGTPSRTAETETLSQLRQGSSLTCVLRCRRFTTRFRTRRQLGNPNPRGGRFLLRRREEQQHRWRRD